MDGILQLYQQKKNMDEIKEEEEQIFNISIKRPFIPKFFKQLNHHQNEKMRKSKRKQKNHSLISQQKLEKFQKLGVPLQHKSSKKLQQINHNGNRIFATWKNDQINGDAEIHYNNGVVFKGVYQNGIKVKGHFKFLNGYEYVGNCLGNKFFGEGCLIFPSGKIISGEWKEYQVVGNGKIEYPQGEVYFGQIQNFKKQGKGYLFFSDGSKYVGEFDKGMINGVGTYFVDDKPVSKGVWNNGQLTQPGDLQEINEQTIKVNVDEMQDKADKIEKGLKQKSTRPKDPQNKQKQASITDFFNVESESTAKNRKVRFND